MKPRDIEALHSVSRPTIHPDGTRAVVAVSRPDLAADATVGQLWSVMLDGSGARRITRGRRDSAPAFSPDGNALAFLRAEKGSTPQLVVVPAGGGEAVQLTDAKLGVTDFRWSPDSTRIVYVAAVPEQGRYGTVEAIVPAAEPGRHITDLTYKLNGTGYTEDQRPHVFLVTVPELDGEPSYTNAPLPDGSTPESAPIPTSLQLTDGPFSDSEPRFAGDRIVFLSARHEHRDRDLVNQLWSVDVAGSEDPVPVTDLGTISISSIEWVEGTFYLLAQELGPEGKDFVGRNSALYRLEGRTPVALTDPESTDATGGSIAVAGERLLVPNLERGRIQVLEVGAEVRHATGGDIEVSGIAAAGEALVVSYATPDSFGEVGLLVDGAITALTDFGAAVRATGLVAPTELTVTGRDGYAVHGWVARPAGEGPHPTLLMIHGGPYASYGIHAFDETQVYVDAGYAVVYCNPRGSAGYGQQHGRVIKGAMGGVDMHDVLDFLDGALDADPQLDRERLGILGGSYGGYLTAWTIAHDHRFRAAVVERGYLDPGAFVGSSDIGWMFPQQYNGPDIASLRAQSPQEVAHLVTTPTFVIHSEEDLRCPLAQAETYYATLKLQGTEAELLIFPGENHELSRSGRPRHRVQRFEEILDWFGRHL